MNTVTETIIAKAEQISRARVLDTLVSRVTRRIVPQTTAAAACTGQLYGSSCRIYPGDYCNSPRGNGKFQYMYDAAGNYCGWICCH